MTFRRLAIGRLGVCSSLTMMLSCDQAVVFKCGGLYLFDTGIQYEPHPDGVLCTQCVGAPMVPTDELAPRCGPRSTHAWRRVDGAPRLHPPTPFPPGPIGIRDVGAGAVGGGACRRKWKHGDFHDEGDAHFHDVGGYRGLYQGDAADDGEPAPAPL